MNQADKGERKWTQQWSLQTEASVLSTTVKVFENKGQTRNSMQRREGVSETSGSLNQRVAAGRGEAEDTPAVPGATGALRCWTPDSLPGALSRPLSYSGAPQEQILSQGLECKWFV